MWCSVLAQVDDTTAAVKRNQTISALLIMVLCDGHRRFWNCSTKDVFSVQTLISFSFICFWNHTVVWFHTFAPPPPPLFSLSFSFLFLFFLRNLESTMGTLGRTTTGLCHRNHRLRLVTFNRLLTSWSRSTSRGATSRSCASPGGQRWDLRLSQWRENTCGFGLEGLKLSKSFINQKKRDEKMYKSLKYFDDQQSEVIKVLTRWVRIFRLTSLVHKTSWNFEMRVKNCVSGRHSPNCVDKSSVGQLEASHDHDF